MKRKYTPKATVAFAFLISGAMALLWLASMFCLTSVRAEHIASDYLSRTGERASDISQMIMARFSRDTPYKNYELSLFWDAVDRGETHKGTFAAEGGNDFIKLRDYRRPYFAAAVYDGEGNLIVKSTDDYFTFEYMTEEQWLRGEERSGDSAIGYFDRSKLTEKGLKAAENNDISEFAALRFEGTFDGVGFTPSRIEGVDYELFRNTVWENGFESYTVSGVTEKYDLPWELIYEDADAQSDTVFYSDMFEICFSEKSPPFEYRGREYKDLDDFITSAGSPLKAEPQLLPGYYGGGLVIPDICINADYEGENIDFLYYSEDYLSGEDAKINYCTVSAVYVRPWHEAFHQLRNVYIFTFVFGLVLVMLVCYTVNRHFIRPAALTAEAMEKERDRIAANLHNITLWKESESLKNGFEKYTNIIRIRNNEIQRLNKALEYVENVEKNRRRMVSNIAHELKTPLAVVHSYAEGLQENIAENKRDRYLDVILSESERMDSMVLEMLDLSRLEAGRVKLVTEEFSLSELTKSVFDRLSKNAEDRGISTGFDFEGDCIVTADEGRMSQVIENLASNAIKYGKKGSRAEVKIRRRGGRTYFTLENESEPFSDEMLEGVWDSFYRKDESSGTGLGLAIVKNIVELHGGKCTVRNTEKGVEFGFTI